MPAAATLAAISTLLSGVAAAQGLPPIERTLANGSTVRFYGQINKGILQYDDGRETKSYFLIDNDNSGTRVGLSYTQEFGDWTFENVNEFSYAPYSTSNINIVDDSPDSADYEFSNANIRYLDFTLANDRVGKFYAGQGSMATDGILEIDLSGTDIIAYSGVGDSAGAQILRFSDPALADDLSGPQIGDVFANLDGDRRVRVRYDTREFANFTAAVAFGRDLLSDDADERDQNIFDAALTYGTTYDNGVEVAAGIGYNWQDSDSSIWGGSASALHQPTGLNLTLAAGQRNGDDSGDATFWYGKLGLIRPFLPAVGDTAMSIDYYSGDDFGLDEATGVTSSSSDSWGLALVQNIDRANTQLWLTYRNYDYADNADSYEDGQAIFGGALFQF
jgi:hypothetical protein